MDEFQKQFLSACKSGDVTLAKEFLNQGVKVESMDEAGRTALNWASWKGHTPIVNLLLANEADVNTKGVFGQTALHMASEKGFAEIVSALLEKGADINGCNNGGRTALHRATNRGHIEIIRMLLDRGSNISIKDNDGETALDIARRHEAADIIQLLEASLQTKAFQHMEMMPDVTHTLSSSGINDSSGGNAPFGYSYAVTYAKQAT